jgi:ABC-type lipoprotein release transport system permease subunit
VQLLDPVVLGSVLAGLLLMALAASLGPARSAAREDPMQVLRME